jgi:hypothetical protein
MYSERSESSKKTKYGLIKRILQHKTPDDVIAVMLSFLDLEQIPSSYRVIHTCVNRLKEEYPELLEEFVFSHGDFYPFSRLLERVLFRLQNSGLINTINPDFDVCVIPIESKKYIKDNILPLFSEEEQRKLKEMSVKFQELLNKIR